MHRLHRCRCCRCCYRPCCTRRRTHTRSRVSIESSCSKARRVEAWAMRTRDDIGADMKCKTTFSRDMCFSSLEAHRDRLVTRECEQLHRKTCDKPDAPILGIHYDG